MAPGRIEILCSTHGHHYSIYILPFICIDTFTNRPANTSTSGKPKSIKPFHINTGFLKTLYVLRFCFIMAPALDVYDDTCADNYHNQALGKTKSGKTLKIRTYPKFDTLEEERLYRKQHLAAAFRIFADRGFDEGVAGHISLRDPILTDHFCRYPIISQM